MTMCTNPRGLVLCLLLLLSTPLVFSETPPSHVLNPPYFNLAEGRSINASATCGVGVFEPELYCKLVGANTDKQDNPNINLIQGQLCQYCNPSDPRLSHPAENAIDGTEKWWMSPPLSRGNRYNEVNVTIKLGQEFHVAYVFIKMGNSPRPAVWILERSTDYGKTFQPWQYFAGTPGECVQNFGPEALQPLVKDDSVICETKFSKVVPLEGGEIVVSLLNDRPNADNFSYSTVLQEFTKATDVRLRFLRTKTLLGHLMSVTRQDPTVTRRYFYSIKDLNIGGRCVCNGHAETCDPREPYKLLCRCEHNTCGDQCEVCCSGYQQKPWRPAIVDHPFECEPCNCFGHSKECIYAPDVDDKRLSLDIHGHYSGGGVCQNCAQNTEGINCNKCKPTYYRPYGKLLNATDVCQPCHCDPAFSTGNCADGSGQCECRVEFLPPYCNACNYGYYGYPACQLCDCHPNGTNGNICEVGGGQCPCKPNYSGHNCNSCKEGFYGFPDCLPCNCNPSTSLRDTCDEIDGQCRCQNNYGGRQCDECQVGYYNYPICDYCACDQVGCVEEICDSNSGVCLCKPGFGGQRCDRCAPTYYGYPKCVDCQCDVHGSIGPACDFRGQCPCLTSYAGLKCNQCSPGYYDFPNCFPCNCEPTGSIGISCSDEGHCVCKSNFDREKCDRCKEGFYNFPYCEECNCDPAGVLSTFLGCGSLTSGELCECKERVTGRICNECKPLFWNLKISNPLGCEDCNCYFGGTIGGIAVCGKEDGVCHCKPNVESRQCSQCKDGSYYLDATDLFGCKDCSCNVGGSVNSICDKLTGQCICRPRITGRQCDKPLQTHYFPTLFQHQFEIEDGTTPIGTQVRYGYDENIYTGFSSRGYAVFSDIQKEVLLDIFVEKSSLYQVLFHYLNFGGENIFGTITFTPETTFDIQQSSDMVFQATTKPKLMKVSGKQGLLAFPLVLNPGRWAVSIRVEKPLFLDYMVLLPQSYYEATLLQEDVKTPCKIQGESDEMCRLFKYPPLHATAEIERGEDGYVMEDEDKRNTNVFDDEEVLKVLETSKMALLNEDQQTLQLDFNILNPGLHVMIVTYHTPESGETTTAEIEVSSADRTGKGKATFYDCSYSFLCREVVLDKKGKVAQFDLQPDYASVLLETSGELPLEIDSVAFVPANLWHMDYIKPDSSCVSQNGECLDSVYLPIPEATKVEFESGENENRKADVLPEGIINNDIGLVYLHDDENTVDLYGTVPVPGLYTFVIHYYQPNYPEFEAKVVIDTDEVYEAVLPFSYCPSTSGCRTIAHATSHAGDDTSSFPIKENFVTTINQPANKSVWIDYVLSIPVNQLHESMLNPLPQDRAGKFITECGENNFLISHDVTGFCRDSAFSLASEYNNGALSCQCNTDASLSFECSEFGGQCQCKPNVIGRTCSQCRTGYFGFPNCKACDCPSTAYCHPITGQCICPPRVTGDKCDQCVPYTYGFDPIIGCEECNCHALGVYAHGSLQCDLLSGQCRCKSNVVGRICEKCKAGYWAFPHCELCNCDLRGTTEEICEQDSARCYCKENVFGDSCDQCKPGSFYLEESNPLGCTKCFCFGTTERCSSAYLFKVQMLDMRNWGKIGADLDDYAEKEVNITLLEAGNDIQVSISDEMPERTLFYFSAPEPYLGNKLSSYGGNLSYTMYITIDQDAPTESFVGPDLIMRGNNITLLHDNIEQPAAGIPFTVNINLIEHEFHHMSGREVTREQIMMVLVNLEYLWIRGSYFHPSVEVRLMSVLLDVTSDQYVGDAPQALRVEQCQCQASYIGNSCEDCAPGYYRTKPGPYLGYCVPCQCHGHTETCDVTTGKCIDCKHNTIGDHCEKCSAGYHGDATQGTPYDCLICACPLPIESNNFAESCEVSPSGLEISCNCKPGYYGARCEGCEIGFFGEPEVPGSKCEPCNCSGNIDPSKPGSCDSVSGDCILCLNNTFGAACELCAPGFYGDAISKKDCKKCDCDEFGIQQCNHGTGECICWPNVEGSTCDRCIENHWGFSSGSGCRPCNCASASRSEQCDLESGQCPCKPGAGSPTCDSCLPGFWKYTSNGCIPCNCDEKYSAGAVCDAVNGHCRCLPGVLGEKCDKCPHRWVFLRNEGCLECEPCVHGLLDTSDKLEDLINPVMDEMKDVSFSYFANKRLQNVNKTAETLRIGIDELIQDPSDLDYTPLVYEVQSLEKKRDQIERAASHSYSQAIKVNSDADATRKEALELENVRDNIAKAQEIVLELGKLSAGLQGSLGQNVDNIIAEAEFILNEIMKNDYEPSTISQEEYEASELSDRVQAFELPVLSSKEMFDEENEKTSRFVSLLSELDNSSRNAYSVANDAQILDEESHRIPVKELIQQIERLTEKTADILKNASDLLQKTGEFSDDAKNAYKQLDRNGDSLGISIVDLKDHIKDIKERIEEIQTPIESAKEHATFLTTQAEDLDKSLADTRNSSDAAVKAANAYSNIEKAIDESYAAAESALQASYQAGSMSDGVLDKTDASKRRTTLQYDDSSQLEQKVKDLEPQLDFAKNGVLHVSQQNRKTMRVMDVIKKDLDKLPLRSLEALAGHAANGSAVADKNAQEALGKLQNIISQLPEEEVKAQQVPNDLEESRQSIRAGHSYVDRIASIVPDTNHLMDRSSKKMSAMKILGTDVSEKLKQLQKKVAVARTKANTIKLGVQFFENTTLELRNPEGMEKAATHTHISLYFKTTERYGLLFYVGNEKGAHKRMKRVLTDDYFALEVRGGRLVMTMDLGSGAQNLKHETYVSDGRWHQAIIERTGKSCSLTVKTEGEADVQVEGSLPGTFSVFNLDQKNSKFFIGGITDKFSVQDTIENTHFDGCIEQVEFLKTPVGLFDFVKAENIDGCNERTELVQLDPSNGLRFGGSGYVKLQRKRLQLSTETTIKMRFKTYAKNGLLFFIGKHNNYLTLELEEGRLLFKYDLGSGAIVLQSTEKYNDGKWHSLEAARSYKLAVLKVDNSEVDSGESPGQENTLSVTNEIFVGGHSGKHSHRHLSGIGFKGCIEDMQIGAEIIDLNKNKEALDVVNGCPVTIAQTVSYSPQSAGYVGMPSSNLGNIIEITFKFKTQEEDGLIFYASNDDQSNYLHIALQSGNLVMSSNPGAELKTNPEQKFNDSEWHYVSATLTGREMRLDIDDVNSVEIEVPDGAETVSITSPLYFGGVPEGHTIKAKLSPFIGCIGDATVNNRFQNFADTEDRVAASLASCPLDDDTSTTTQSALEFSIPLTPVTTTLIENDTSEVTDSPEIPIGKCGLPLHPRIDKSVKPGSGVRFGNTPASRQEFSKSGTFMASILDDSTFALEFRTYMNNGVLFYIAGNKHIDFIGLFMQAGKIFYVFNCGTGKAIISSQNMYNDNSWHRVVFSRKGPDGRLVLDDDEEVRGTSVGSATSVNVKQPFYIGGLSPETQVIQNAKNNLKGVTSSFPGCIKNVEAQGEVLTLKKPSVSESVTNCSDMVEPGTYISAAGGHLILYDNYRVGHRVSIKVDIKPRNLSGIIMAVHGRIDYLILQMIDGRISFTVDNGAGPFTSIVSLPDEQSLCDGNWHTIQAAKTNNFVTISVDDTFSEPGIGVGGVSSTNTNDPLYIGGAPDPTQLKGVETLDSFVGCLRNLELNSKPQLITESRVFGQVTLNSCPTI